MAQHNDTYVTHSVKKGESLWSIARDYYGNGSMWGAIYQYNELKKETVYTGQKLKVPMANTGDTELKSAFTKCMSAIEALPEYKELNKLL